MADLAPKRRCEMAERALVDTHAPACQKSRVMAATTKFIDVYVESNDEIPTDCMMRFHALAEPVLVNRIRYHADGEETVRVWRVASKHSDGSVRPAYAVPVDDSGGGTSTLIFGADFGLRLHRDDAEAVTVAEPYLLLDASAVVD